jgi:DNA-directed RNA polymerase specialized sigma24 family protein
MEPATSSDETEHIVRNAQKGCPHAFARLFTSYYAGMLAVASQILGPGPDAEDACQDAAITAFGRIGELRDPGAVRAWHGLRQLSPAVQPVATLRYFTVNNSYEQIAALCGIPVGAVRSRLSEARRQLAEVLPRVEDQRRHLSADRSRGRRRRHDPGARVRQPAAEPGPLPARRHLAAAGGPGPGQ